MLTGADKSHDAKAVLSLPEQLAACERPPHRLVLAMIEHPSYLNHKGPNQQNKLIKKHEGKFAIMTPALFQLFPMKSLLSVHFDTCQQTQLHDSLIPC
jgi:hypothetical protein